MKSLVIEGIGDIPPNPLMYMLIALDIMYYMNDVGEQDGTVLPTVYKHAENQVGCTRISQSENNIHVEWVKA